MRSLPPIRPALSSEQIEAISIWMAANDQAWIRDVRRAANGDWSRLNQRVDLLEKPQFEIEDAELALKSESHPDGPDPQ